MKKLTLILFSLLVTTISFAQTPIFYSISFPNAAHHEAKITPEENPLLEVVTAEKAGQTLTKDQQEFRNKWLSSKVK